MKEQVLQHLWDGQRFGQSRLCTTQGKQVTVLHAGTLNQNAGPDFLSAHIVIDGIDLHGHVEIHRKSSDWYAHGHHEDINYNNVVLHVVWEDNKEVLSQGSPLPTVVLSTFVKRSVVDFFASFESERTPVLCAAHFAGVGEHHRQMMLEEALFRKFGHKRNWIVGLLENNNGDSDVTAYQMLAYAFGFKLNSDVFLMLSQRVPFALVKLYNGNLLALEALLFGGAGFLEGISSPKGYIKELALQYNQFKQRHKLPPPLKKETWRFFKARPKNFPTVRIAQFARTLYQQENLFEFLLNTTYVSFVKRMRKLPSTYWRTHYHFAKKYTDGKGRMGHASINSIVINVIVPLLVTYGDFRKDDFYVEKAMDLLKILPAEVNRITRIWKKIGLEVTSAFDSQACAALLKYFCIPTSCLTCKIGQWILGKHP